MISLTEDLFDFAYFYNLPASLQELSLTAIPEPWAFLRPQADYANRETPVLEAYIRGVYRYLAIQYNEKQDACEQGPYLCFHQKWACFHTGLFTPYFEGIYALLELNKRLNTRFDWVFKGFFPESSAKLQQIAPLPQKPVFSADAGGFRPEWEIRVNYSHILNDARNFDRIPDGVKQMNNLPLLLRAAVQYGRCLASIDPTVAVPQVYAGRVQYLMPICLMDTRFCDLAMTLTPLSGYYLGNTCLTLEMAYHNARLLARPSASWLASLVDPAYSGGSLERLSYSASGMESVA